MSVASASRTIKFISKAGTYSAEIMSPSGDLYQMYEGAPAQIVNIYPHFPTTQPILYFAIVSSRAAEGISTPDSVDYYVAGTKLTFDSSNVSTNNFNGETGHFKKIYPSSGQPYYGLQIIKNLVVAFNFAPVSIKMVGALSYGTQSDTIEATYNIPIQKSTGTQLMATIAAGDNNNFVLRDKNSTVILTAKAFRGGTEITTGLTYAWEKLTQSGWSTLSTTTRNLTVGNADVDTYGQFRVTISDGTESAQDIQSVLDASDPYEIDPRPTPEDETITEDESGNGQVVYTPRVVKRGSTATALSCLFTFIVKDSAGVYLNPASERTTPAASCTVTRAYCLAAGGDVSIDIFAVEST